jgi:hypothetical protein
MYGLPANFNAELFQGKTLLQVCIGAHELILNFDEGLSVTITSSVEFKRSDGSSQYCDDFCASASTVSSLVNKKVITAEAEAPRALKLKFENGEGLSIVDDSKEFESYTINYRGKTIVV